MRTRDHLDEKASQIARRLAERTSRRGLLAKTGRWALAIAGVTALETLPIGPVQLAEAGPSDCWEWYNCGMSGFPCAGCGGSTGSCPAGTTAATGQGAAWSACCADGYGGLYLVQYRDCCYHNAAGQCCSGSSPNGNPWCCPNEFCRNAGQVQTWCGTGGQNCYKCTMANVLYSCL
jgi:hypothetical protein